MKIQTLSNADRISLLTAIVGLAVTYGILTTRLSAQEEKLRELAPVGRQLAVISERIEAIDKRSASTDKMVQEIWNYLLPRNREP